MKRINVLIILLFSIPFCTFSKVNRELPKTTSRLSFKENKGQVGDQFSKARPDVLFVGNSGNLVFHLRKNGISYQMYRVDTWKEVKDKDVLKNLHSKSTDKLPEQTTIYRLDINWLHSNLNVTILKEKSIEGYDNYYSEICPNGVTSVMSYKNVTYQNLYKGIDLKWYEKDGNLKYDYIVKPGVDHKQIRLEIKGAESISLDKNGDLIIKTPLGVLIEKAPYVSQNNKPLKARWKVEKNIVSFDITDVDSSKSLVIDPLVRLWGTYYGGTSDDRFFNSVVDAAGNVYAVGYSDSQTNIATSGSHQIVSGGGPPGPGSANSDDAILIKFNSAGVRLWGTYYGGSGSEFAQNCSLDPTGNYIAMVGVTSTSLSGVIATPGAHQPNYAGNASHYSDDAFLAVFDATGVRQWGTYYGGDKNEFGWGCCYDINGDIYISGLTTSTNGISSPGAHQTLYGGGQNDGYIAKFNNTGTLLWATYYGGSNLDRIISCSTDPSGNVFGIGDSKSANNISTPGSYQALYSGPSGFGDGIIIKFNSSGVRQWGTYYGGQGDDQAYNCVLDPNGNIYVAGITSVASQTAITTFGAHQTTFGGSTYDAFLLKLSSAGARIWCTLYGGLGSETFSWCSIDPYGSVYLSGCTTSTNNISSSCAYQIMYSGSIDCYLSKFDSNGAQLWGTYFGGDRYDDYCSNSTDLSGNVYMVGWTDSRDHISTSSSHQPFYGGGVTDVDGDGFLVKFDGCIPNPINTTDSSSLAVCKGQSTKLTMNSNCKNTWYDLPFGGVVISDSSVFITPTLSANTAFYMSEESCGSNTVRTAVTVTVNNPPIVSIDFSPTVLCYKTSLNAKASGAVSYTWFPDKWINCTSCTDVVLSPLETIEYCLEGMDGKSCVGKTCKTVVVDLSRDHNFSLPNAFTPNGDRLNDSFCLQGWDNCNDSFLIRIFDRWGEKVFESDDPNFCWNGIYKGQLLSGEVYVYSVSAKYKDDTIVNKKGNITLIR